MPLTAEQVWYWRARLGAMAAILLGRRGSAEAAFDALLQRWPDDAYGLASRSHLLAQRGAQEEALADAERLVALHPERGAADWFNLGFIREALGRPAEAEAAFRRAVEINPKLDRAWYGLGLSLVRLERLDEAAEALKRNTELQPMSPFGWYQLARLQVDRNKPEQARRIIAHLKGFEPKVAERLERETGLAG